MHTRAPAVGAAICAWSPDIASAEDDVVVVGGAGSDCDHGGVVGVGLGVTDMCRAALAQP